MDQERFRLSQPHLNLFPDSFVLVGVDKWVDTNVEKGKHNRPPVDCGSRVDLNQYYHHEVDLIRPPAHSEHGGYHEEGFDDVALRRIYICLRCKQNN